MLERSFRIDEKDYKILQEIGEHESVAVSYLVRTAIKRYIRDYSYNVDFMEITGKRGVLDVPTLES